MSNDVRDIVEHTIEALVAEVASLTLDGWAISQSNPGDAVGFGRTYTVSMYRDADTVEAFRLKATGVAEKPKMTRAETLQVARQARAMKSKLDVETIQ